MAQVRQEVLDEIVRRIVEVAQPERIILFGSASRGEMGPNSDLDLLVVKSGVHRRRLAQAIYMNLIGVGQAVDVIVVTPEDIERYRNAIGLVIEPALEEGLWRLNPSILLRRCPEFIEGTGVKRQTCIRSTQEWEETNVD